jgi:hypothetical protein
VPFGSGWESIWDLRLDDGQIVGPLPAEPIAEPAEGVPVALSDGSTLTFGDDRRLLGNTASYYLGNTVLTISY